MPGAYLNTKKLTGATASIGCVLPTDA